MEREIHHRWQNGVELKAHTYFGAHPFEQDGIQKCIFRLYAPSAKSVYVKGDFNGWYTNIPMHLIGDGVWEVEIENVPIGTQYKYGLVTPNDEWLEKTDPFAKSTEQFPSFNSRVCAETYHWNDQLWLDAKKHKNISKEALLIYEVHVGSWQKTKDNKMLNYRDIAPRLISYVKECGFTHIELLPLAEHPFIGSWGYQQTGLFAPTSRYGTPDDLRFFIDYAHNHGIGVILDFVPVHFCKDMHGLQTFDGTNLYEYGDWKRENEGWGTLNFDLGKGDVQSFLLSSLDYWISSFHIDGFRFDAVSHLIYRAGIKERGENEEGLAFVRHMNGLLEFHYPEILRIAEDSSDFQGVTRSTQSNGLGFHFKWDLGYANDHFHYMATPYDKRNEQSAKITFARAYHETEQFLLPFSHDEVVHGKKSMLMKQQGDKAAQFSALSVEYAFWIFHPGKKLLFMGQEFGQEREWNEAESLDWYLLNDPAHRAFFEQNKRLFHLYKNEKVLYTTDYTVATSFKWILIDAVNSVYAIQRSDAESTLLGIFHFGNTETNQYTLDIPKGEYINVFTGEQLKRDAQGQWDISIKKLSYQIYRLRG